MKKNWRAILVAALLTAAVSVYGQDRASSGQDKSGGDGTSLKDATKSGAKDTAKSAADTGRVIGGAAKRFGLATKNAAKHVANDTRTATKGTEKDSKPAAKDTGKAADKTGKVAAKAATKTGAAVKTDAKATGSGVKKGTENAVDAAK